MAVAEIRVRLILLTQAISEHVDAFSKFFWYSRELSDTVLNMLHCIRSSNSIQPAQAK
jgi:hypothetical protein